MTSSQKQQLPTNGFFLNNLRQHMVRRKQLSKKEMYNWYHKKIAEKQAKRASELAVVFELIRKRISKLGVNWEDEAAQKIRDSNIEQLSQLQLDIMGSFTKDGTEFLTALKKVLNFNET